ncbi:MAG: DUF2283 domain-containing protein [Syntrophobacteraceae bacterium]|jgi:uncharacterized protein YuzE
MVENLSYCRFWRAVGLYIYPHRELWISENIYVDLDKQGNLVSMTIEHARTNARLNEFSYQEIDLAQEDGRTMP